jgi:hypothetical protein
MRNEGGRCGQVRRLLESGRGIARIAPSLMARCDKEATPLGGWRDRPAPDPWPIGPRPQSVRLSRFASPWFEADLAKRAPLSGAEWLADIDVDSVVIATPAARRARRGNKPTHSVHEAVYLADRVIVLTRNPTRIRGVITVDLRRPRHRLSDAFHVYVKALVRLIRQHN